MSTKKLPITMVCFESNPCFGISYLLERQAIQSSTIMNYLAAVRYFFKKTGGNCLEKYQKEEKVWGERARHIIARELGHSRINITKVYYG